jgi:hypothetical protein
VPLSEDEQRILHEIERQFYEHDPDFARGVSSTTLYTHAGRNLKWATLGFVAGLVLMLASFTTSLWLGFAGFLAMLACAIVFERNLRKMGRAGWNSMTQTLRGGNFKGSLGDASKRMRDRFKRGES